MKKTALDRMPARLLLLALSLLLLVSCAPSEPEKAEGVLSASELSKFESMYWMSREEVLNALSFTEGDIVESGGDGVMFALPDRRTVCGYELTPCYEISVGEPAGMYRVRYHSGPLSGLDAEAIANELYEDAAAQYGESTTGLYQSLTNDSAVYSALWEVGEKTTFQLSVGAGSVDLSYRYRTSLLQQTT